MSSCLCQIDHLYSYVVDVDDVCARRQRPIIKVSYTTTPSVEKLLDHRTYTQRYTPRDKVCPGKTHITAKPLPFSTNIPPSYAPLQLCKLLSDILRSIRVFECTYLYVFVYFSMFVYACTFRPRLPAYSC